MNTKILLSILITMVLISLFLLTKTESLNFQVPYVAPTQKPNPKQELIDYLAFNWDRLYPHFMKDNCDDNVCPEIMNEFTQKFGHYMTSQDEKKDPILEHYAKGTYYRGFQMEFREICQTLKKLQKYIKNNQSTQLKEMKKELELLHTEHFPQAVFISVILDQMAKTCSKFPYYSLTQIVNTNDLLTISVVDSLLRK